MKPEHLHILQHSLGVDQYGQGGRYRDYYCSCVEDSPTQKNLQDMVAIGWMREGHKINEGREQYYFVTSLGLSAMIGHSPKPPVLTRSQQYCDWLNFDCGMSFWEYLKALPALRRQIKDGS